MIKLVDFLDIAKEDYKNYKLHFAIVPNRKEEIKEVFYSGKFDEWQSRQTNKNFSRKYVISLIWFNNDNWLFGGIYEVIGKPTPLKVDNWNGYNYPMKQLPIQADMIGRVILKYKKEYRASYPNLELDPKKGKKPSNIEVSQILEEKLTVDDFLGFDNVNISYSTLEIIINKRIVSWKDALSKVKGVYLIVDTKTGKQYVGSAYGDECIWSRWFDYAANGHGGNKQLKEIIKCNDSDYKYNFKYSVLEICNMNIGNDYIIGRESYWKEVLLSREFGLNSN